MRYIFFDTETNGLPLDWKAPAEDVGKWPRITQLAWAVYEDSQNGGHTLLNAQSHLIKPDGWEIPKEKFFLDQGFSTERSMKEGVPLTFILRSFALDRLSSDFSIAHNIAFDAKVIRAEMIREDINVEFASKKICTMMSSTKHCKLPNTNGNLNYKWPKLEELHAHLFSCDFEGAHDAMNDVMACAKCFFELKKIGVINLWETIRSQK